MVNANYPLYHYFSVVKEKCRSDALCYRKIYGDLVYWVDHYYYSKNSPEMKYLFGGL